MQQQRHGYIDRATGFAHGHNDIAVDTSPDSVRPECNQFSNTVEASHSPLIQTERAIQST